MSKRDLSGMINQASSDLEPVRKRGRGLQGMFSDTSAPEQPEPEGAIIQDGETTLSAREAEELATCERIIERGLRTFLEVGSALLKIRDLRLYRNEYATFEDYYRERWSLERSQVYRLMDAAEVTRNLQSSPMGEVPLPSNERQVRPLTKLKDPEEQRKAWERAATTAAGRVTAAHVEAVVREMLAQAAPAATAPLADEHEAAPAQQVVIDQADENGLFLDGEPAPAQDDWLHLTVQTDEEEDAAALRQENAALRQRLADVQSVLEEYQQHITRAQNYKPTSERGEVVSPFLRLVERVYNLLRDKQ